MSARLLSLCLYAYPRAVRERDGEQLGELATDLAGDHGVLREAWGLVRGGAAERRRRRSRVGRTVIALAAATLLALTALTWTATAQGERAEEDLFACAAQCADAEAEVEARIRDGWTCTERTAPVRASWRCVRD